MLRRIKHFLLTLAALVFLIEAWLWDMTLALGHWFVGLIPFESFKAAVARLIDRLPPYGVLPFFLLPFLVIEPLKVAALRSIGHHHYFRGIFGFIVLKFVGVALIAFVFDLCRSKLMQIDWFARFYDWVVMWRDRAHQWIAPYKAEVKARIAELRAQIFTEQRGGLVETLMRLRARVRRARG